VVKGTYAISSSKHILEEYYTLFKSKIIDDRIKFYVSEYGEGISPYFIIFSRVIDIDLKKDLNKM